MVICRSYSGEKFCGSSELKQMKSLGGSVARNKRAAGLGPFGWTPWKIGCLFRSLKYIKVDSWWKIIKVDFWWKKYEKEVVNNSTFREVLEEPLAKGTTHAYHDYWVLCIPRCVEAASKSQWLVRAMAELGIQFNNDLPTWSTWRGNVVNGELFHMVNPHGITPFFNQQVVNYQNRSMSKEK